MPIPEKTKEKIVNMLDTFYDTGMVDKCIQEPITYALYHTWKHSEEFGTGREEQEKND